MNEENILKRKIKIEAVRLPEGNRLGSLVLAGGWQSSLTKAKAERLKPFEGMELEIGEIIRLAFED
jgi:hypothetical protein